MFIGARWTTAVSCGAEMKRKLEALGWMLAYGVTVGFLWDAAYTYGPYLRSLG